MTITRKQKWEWRQLYGRFKRLINNISHEKTWIWLRKGNFKRETESLLRVAQENAVRTHHIKARIDKTQQNSKCRLCNDRDETINHIISECGKLAQRNIRLATSVWARWSTGSCAKNLNLTIRTNGICTTQHLFWDFNMHTDHLLSARKPDLIIINKKRELSTSLSRLSRE